jgi:pimeloyl-ACP methyl ester carboxylesterase
MAEQAAVRPSVVLVHGLWGNRQVMQPLADKLAHCGFVPAIFQYPSVRGNLTQNTQRLADFIAAQPYAPHHLVGHSLGCILIARLLQRHHGLPVARVVFLGPPFTGCALAEWAHRFPPLRLWLGKSIIEGLVQTRPAWHGSHPLGVIAGTRPLGMGHLLRRLPGANDGLVQVCETQVPGAADWMTLPVHHVGMLYAQEVANAVCCFLHQGRFALSPGRQAS